PCPLALHGEDRAQRFRSDICLTLEQVQSSIEFCKIVLNHDVIVALRPLHVAHIQTTKLHVTELCTSQINTLHLVARKCFAAERLSIKEHLIELTFEPAIHEDRTLKVNLR